MQQVCGLKWSHDDWELASGGNDNQLLVWNQHSRQPALRLTEHTAAVKAIAWSPHQGGLLASGGGTANRCIRFWNTTNGHQLNSVDTGSQVCNLAWSKNVNEIVSTHGYSRNQIMMWKYPSMTKVATLTAHIMRVLYLAMSPDGQTIVTGAGDETLRFWNVFPSMKTPINTSERHRSLVSWANPNSMIFFAHVNIFWSLVFGLLGEPKFDDILCTREYVLVMKMERKGLVYTVYETVIYL